MVFRLDDRQTLWHRWSSWNNRIISEFCTSFFFVDQTTCRTGVYEIIRYTCAFNSRERERAFPPFNIVELYLNVLILWIWLFFWWIMQFIRLYTPCNLLGWKVEKKSFCLLLVRFLYFGLFCKGPWWSKVMWILDKVMVWEPASLSHRPLSLSRAPCCGMVGCLFV